MLTSDAFTLEHGDGLTLANRAFAVKIELKYQITHDGIVYEPRVHDLPERLIKQLTAKWPWAVVPLTKIELKHPITHDGTHYPRGVHELPEAIGQLFLLTAPHAASPFIEPKSAQVQQATVSSRDEADQTKTSAKRQKAETIDRNRPTKWQDLELIFLSDYQLQVRN